MAKLSGNNKIEVVSEAAKVAVGSLILAGALYFIDLKTGFLANLAVERRDVVMIGLCAVGFALFWIIMDKTFFSPFIKLFEARERLTVGAEAELKEKESLIKDLLEDYEAKKLQALTAALAEKNHALSGVKAEAQRMVDSAKEESQAAIKSARAALEAESERLAGGIQHEGELLAKQVVDKVIAGDQTRL